LTSNNPAVASLKGFAWSEGPTVGSAGMFVVWFGGQEGTENPL
jgi:hypothetical protein